MRLFLANSIGAFVFLLGSPLLAVDAFEIQVYDSEINEIGKYSLETHLNHVFAGTKVDPEPGLLTSAGSSHLTFEFARGMTPFWELGFYLQTAVSALPQGYYGGVKLRNKFVLPRKESSTFHLGVNVEVSDIPTNIEPDQFGMEIRPIIGFEDHRFKLLFNPILESALTGSDALVQEFTPALKLMYKATKSDGVGIEYYSGLGPINRFSSLAMPNTEEEIYIAWDLLGSSLELNVGAGWGFTNSSNGFVFKVIIGTEI